MVKSHRSASTLRAAAALAALMFLGASAVQAGSYDKAEKKKSGSQWNSSEKAKDGKGKSSAGDKKKKKAKKKNAAKPGRK
ncbi:MAG: hypothetical protein ACT4O3_10200, partial [Elusimicrobiota bacterium]